MGPSHEWFDNRPLHQGSEYTGHTQTHGKSNEKGDIPAEVKDKEEECPDHEELADREVKGLGSSKDQHESEAEEPINQAAENPGTEKLEEIHRFDFD